MLFTTSSRKQKNTGQTKVSKKGAWEANVQRIGNTCIAKAGGGPFSDSPVSHRDASKSEGNGTANRPGDTMANADGAQRLAQGFLMETDR